jgi:sugar phosphate isomerase/epimerase
MTYASLPFWSIEPDDAHLLLLEKLGLRPELSFESGWSRLSFAQHRQKAALLLDRFPSVSVHLPYAGLYPGEEEYSEAARSKMLRAAETAALYRPDHLIAHPGYRSITDSVLGRKKFPGFKRDNLENLAQTPAQWWLDRSLALWPEVISISQAPLYLENTQEYSPVPIMILLTHLGPKARFCLDFGHWFHYAMGRHWDNLDYWLSLAGRFIKHVHVHDNNGESDQHLALGRGLIDYGQIRRLLKKHRLKPTLTVENHRPASLAESWEILAQDPLWLAGEEEPLEANYEDLEDGRRLSDLPDENAESGSRAAEG